MNLLKLSTKFLTVRCLIFYILILIFAYSFPKSLPTWLYWSITYLVCGCSLVGFYILNTRMGEFANQYNTTKETVLITDIVLHLIPFALVFWYHSEMIDWFYPSVSLTNYFLVQLFWCGLYYIQNDPLAVYCISQIECISIIVLSAITSIITYMNVS